MRPSAGRASVLGTKPAHADAPYIEKYTRGLSGLNLTPERFSEQYSVAVDIELTKVRGF